MKSESKALIKDVVLTTLVLVLIAVIAGGILGVVNKLTYIDPVEALNAKLNKIYDSPQGFSANLYDKDYIVDGGVYKSGQVLGVYKPNNDSGDVIIHASGSGAYKKTIEIMVVINDYKIIDIAKYASEETPGLGSKAFTVEHLSQYNGDFKDIDTFVLSKNGGTIDAVSGATKTSTAVNNAVNVAITYYKACHDSLVGGNING